MIALERSLGCLQPSRRRRRCCPLPPVAPLGWVNRVRLGRDFYVRVDSSDYSVDPAVIGRFVDGHADLSRVKVRHEGGLVAAHDRVWACGMTVADQPTSRPRRPWVSSSSSPEPTPEPHQGRARDLTRDLVDYDRAFGLTGLSGATLAGPVNGPVSGSVSGEEVA